MAKKQSKSSIAAAAPTTATTTATSPDAPAQSQGSSATTKALPRGPHTLQLVFHLLIHSLLLLLTTLVLPSHLLTRSSSDTTTTHLSFLSSTAYLFRLPATEENAALLKKCMWGGVQGVVLIQGWALMRFRKWWELGEAIESGDRVKAQDVNKRGWAKSAEMLTLSSVSLPATFAIVQALLILVGAPAIKDVTATAQLSLAVTLLIGFPLLHLVSNDMDHWTRLLGVVRPKSKQEVVLLITTFLPLVTAFISGAALTFDHGLAWSSTYPVPILMGLFAGAVVADWIALPVYLFG